MSVLDEEMIHYEENNIKRRKKLIELYYEVDNKMLKSVCVEIDIFKKELKKNMKSYFSGQMKRDRFVMFIDQSLQIAVETVKKRKREGPIKKRKRVKKRQNGLK